MRLLVRCASVGLLLLAGVGPAAAALKVVATTEDLAAIAKDVGGEKVNVETLARGYQDPHFVEPKPSFILKLHAADLLVLVGRELEIGWLPPLIQQSRNAKVQPGANGYPPGRRAKPEPALRPACTTSEHPSAPSNYRTWRKPVRSYIAVRIALIVALSTLITAAWLSVLGVLAARLISAVF